MNRSDRHWLADEDRKKVEAQTGEIGFFSFLQKAFLFIVVLAIFRILAALL